MALKDLLALADDKLHELFHTKPHDPTKARAPIIKGIDRTKNQFASATPAKGKKWFRLSNGVVELNLPFTVGGKSTFYVPSERFTDFLDKLKESVTGGELDKDIEAAGKNAGNVSAPKAKRASTGGTGRGWSPERKAKFEATIAARNASKTK